MMMRHFAGVLLFWLTIIGPATAAELTPRIVDGDTVEIGGVKIRLEGIDAPETDQLCLNAKGQRWTCGIDARDQLINNAAPGRHTLAAVLAGRAGGLPIGHGLDTEPRRSRPTSGRLDFAG